MYAKKIRSGLLRKPGALYHGVAIWLHHVLTVCFKRGQSSHLYNLYIASQVNKKRSLHQASINMPLLIIILALFPPLIISACITKSNVTLTSCSALHANIHTCHVHTHTHTHTHTHLLAALQCVSRAREKRISGQAL